MIKIKVLEYLTALAQYKHFGKAAQACFVSQPTLSGQIMKLEDELGLQLVERNRNNIMLTPAGERLLIEAKQINQAIQSFNDTAKELRDPFAGDIHLGLIPTLAPYLLPHIIEPLNSAFPNINFYLHEDKTQYLLEKLRLGELDCLILPWLEQMNGLDRYDLFNEPFVLATSPSHPLAQHNTVKLSDLNKQQILTLADGHCLRDQALGYCFSAGANEDQRFKATSLETLRHMIISGLGITLMPALATQQTTANYANTKSTQVNSNNICYLPFEMPQPTRQISLVIRPNYSRLTCIRAIVKTLRNVTSAFFS